MDSQNEPSYIRTYRDGILKDRVHQLNEMLQQCMLCPHKCGTDRLSGQTGVCKTAEYALVSSFMPHFGEESPLVGINGSGTIFFTHCNLYCLFCQKYDISHEGSGHQVTDRGLADMMLSLQSLGCHNINFVTPSHVVPQIMAALLLAVEDGLDIPLVFNSGGYDLVDTLQLLDGIIDIYMPDMKFTDRDMSKASCNTEDYPEVMKKAVAEMHRQVGDLVIGSGGTATRGLLVRHLVMPSGLTDTREIMEFLAGKISPDTYVNIMPQYRPCGRSHEIPAINRPISAAEYNSARKIALECGLHRLD